MTDVNRSFGKGSFVGRIWDAARGGPSVVVIRDGTVYDVYPGQTIYTPPGEDHFHASANGTFMEHIAMIESADDPATTTTWKEHITDSDFEGH